jgi:hypothetical protein
MKKMSLYINNKFGWRREMNIDYANLAAVLAAYLAPFAPYLVEGGMKFAGKAGEAAWEETKTLWAKIKSRYGNDPKIQGAILTVSADPQDNDAKALLAKALAARLKESPDFVKELDVFFQERNRFQEIRAENSWIDDVHQKIIRGGGKQTIQLKDSDGIHISQEMED